MGLRRSEGLTACIFAAWTPLRGGRWRRVVGLLGENVTHPVVDPGLRGDEIVDLHIRFMWSQTVHGGLEAVQLQVGSFGHVHRSFASNHAVAPPDHITGMVLGIGPGSSA